MVTDSATIGGRNAPGYYVSEKLGCKMNGLSISYGLTIAVLVVVLLLSLRRWTIERHRLESINADLAEKSRELEFIAFAGHRISEGSIWKVRDIIHYFGEHHPLVSKTEAGRVLATLGQAIPGLSNPKAFLYQSAIADVAPLLQRYGYGGISLENVLDLVERIMVPMNPSAHWSALPAVPLGRMDGLMKRVGE